VATYSRRERVARTVEFVIPAPKPFGACWTEIDKAIDAATEEWRADRGLAEHDVPPDNEICVMPGDEEVIVFYEAKGGGSDG